MAGPVLATEDLSIGYRRGGQRTCVAAGLSLAVEPGRLTGLVGPNGAGKSTLLRTLAGIQPALAGRVLLDGADVHAMPPKDRAQRMAVVLTESGDPGLLDGLGLVALGRHPYTGWYGRLTPHDEAIVRWALAAVGAADLAASPLRELSDGQRGRLMIARALAQESDIILLDEPTAYLDQPRRVEILGLLRQVAHETGAAVLLAIHDLDLALRTADSLWLMTNGRIVAGAPEDLVLGGAFAQVFAGDDVRFDAERGAFRAPTGQGPRVGVAGQGLAHTWTLRALERAGYQPVDGAADLQIVIEEGADGPAWRFAGERFPHIGALLVALAQRAPTD
jgi:iron complex transport system ATP-binding protein